MQIITKVTFYGVRATCYNEGFEVSATNLASANSLHANSARLTAKIMTFVVCPRRELMFMSLAWAPEIRVGSSSGYETNADKEDMRA